MNLFIKSYRIYLIFFVLIACVSGINPGFSQDEKLFLTPWIQEVELPEAYREIPNETLFFDRDNTLYIGKKNGLNIMEGSRIIHLSMPGPVYIAEDGSDTLYYAAENDIGFLIKEDDGTFRTVSRIHLLPASQRVFVPAGIYNASGTSYIYTDRGVYLLSRSGIQFSTGEDPVPEPPPADSVRIRNLLERVGDQIGLPANGIKQVVFRNESEVWILGAHTLHQFNDPSPLNFLETGRFSTGRILCSAEDNGSILLGTTRGIYRISPDPGTNDQWSIADLLPHSSQSIHLFSSVQDQVFAAGSEGLFLVGREQASFIGRGPFTGIKAIKNGTLIASGKAGMVRYHQEQEKWVATTLDPDLGNALSFTCYQDRIFFICNNSVYSSNIKADQFKPVPFHSEDQLYKLLTLNGDLFLLSNSQVYRFDENEEIFQPLPSGPENSVLSGSKSILPVSNQGYWILQNTNDPTSRVHYSNSLNEPVAAFQEFPVLQNLGMVVDMAFTDSVLILTGKDKIFLFDLRSLKELPDRLPPGSAESGSATGAWMFHFSGMELQQFPKPWFRYRVLPYSVAWSPWSPARERSLSGLKHGSYSLEVQAMDLYGRIADAEPLLFTVPPPWYATWYAWVIYGILLLAGLFLLQKWRLLNYRRAESRIAQRMELKIQSLAAEKEKTEKLVADMLPEETANQIRSKGKAKWDKYERATVLFSDIQGFTKIAEEMNPEKLIDELDQFFFHFDSVVEKYNIEKIKTIGDAYMAAGGIPNRNSTNPVEVVLAAIEMQTYMQQLKSTRANIWDLRIGIHTGPVIAGVVGHKKMSYDIWGDTVNTASRMESSGTAGKINISGITYSMVKDYFICEYRGKLPVKYKGNIDMYYVTGLRPELSVDLKGIPNRRFFIKLQILRLGDLEEKVFGDILRSLPESLHFHRLEYARKVYNQSFLLCRSEEIEEEDRLLVRTAALMLYTGLTQDYHNFQNRSAVICREVLPGYKYSDHQIDQICNLILATKTPHNPETQLEKILVDAKMEYIGRPDYTDQLKLLFQELKETGSKINGQQFKNQQLELLYEFQFYTVAGRRLREVSGQKQMNILEKERWI